MENESGANNVQIFALAAIVYLLAAWRESTNFISLLNANLQD